MKQISELKAKEIQEIHNLIKEMGFKIDKKSSNERIIVFYQGFRRFTLYGTNIKDQSYGLAMSFDLDKFLDKNYKIKTKHSTSLQELIYNQEKSHDEAFSRLRWKVLDYNNFTDFDYYSYNDDIDLELIFEVGIRDLEHVVVDDQVYEGEIGPIQSLLKEKRDDIIKELFSSEFIDYLNKLNQ